MDSFITLSKLIFFAFGNCLHKYNGCSIILRVCTGGGMVDAYVSEAYDQSRVSSSLIRCTIFYVEENYVIMGIDRYCGRLIYGRI